MSLARPGAAIRHPTVAGCTLPAARLILTVLPPLTDFVFDREAYARFRRKPGVQRKGLRFHGRQEIASCPQQSSDEQLREFGRSQHFRLGRVDQTVKQIAAGDLFVEDHRVEKRY
jgi:hypothetical protein